MAKYEKMAPAPGPARNRRMSLGGPQQEEGQTYGASEDEDFEADLLGESRQTDDFHAKRWRCVFNPERASETLGPWAKVDITIVKARDLVPAEAAVFVEPTSDAFVKVYIDDEYVYNSPTNYSLNPKWGHCGFINITAPMSMMRFVVCDKAGKKDQDGIGFVELCVGELPVGKEVEGWLELRFMENLQRTSGVRYAFHRTTREDKVTPAQTVEQASRDSHGPLQRAASTESLGYFKSHKTRNHSLLGGCCKCNGPSSRELSRRDHSNAGEIYVKMTLTRSGTKLDELFAHALDPPAPFNFGTFVVEDNAPQVSTQMLWDDTQHIKTTVFNDSLLCLFNWVQYILYWRCFLVSFFITILFASTCVYSWLFPATFPGLFAISLILNSFDSIREEMITSGANATLDQKGFERTASMGSSKQMQSFLRRVVVQLEGSVGDNLGFRTVAMRCFRDGRPTLSFDELVHKLQKAPWITFTKNNISQGSLVLVDERYDAVVADVRMGQGGMEFDVVYDDAVLRSRAPCTHIQRARLTPRASVPKIPEYLIPKAIDAQIRNYHIFLDLMKLKVVPKLIAVTNIVTWRDRNKALMATVCLLVMSCGGIVIVVRQAALEESPVSRMIELIVANLDNAFVLLVGLYVLVAHSGWFVTLRSVMRICMRGCCMKRRAPEGWAFFRPEDSLGARSTL